MSQSTITAETSVRERANIWFDYLSKNGYSIDDARRILGVVESSISDEMFELIDAGKLTPGNVARWIDRELA